MLRSKKRVGGNGSPLTYSKDERVFSDQDIPSAKLREKLEVVESLKSRVLTNQRPEWSNSTSDTLMTAKCYMRTNVNSERNRSNMYVYNFRAEKLPLQYPSMKPKSNKFNTGLLEVRHQDEPQGDSLGCSRISQGICKRTEELPNHPNLRSKTPWDYSVGTEDQSNRTQEFARSEDQRIENSKKCKNKLKNYKNPIQLSIETEHQQRLDKEKRLCS